MAVCKFTDSKSVREFVKSSVSGQNHQAEDEENPQDAYEEPGQEGIGLGPPGAPGSGDGGLDCRVGRLARLLELGVLGVGET